MANPAYGLIDIHSHILHAVDDGPKTWEDSIEMLRIAHEAGTTDIVATPHADHRYTYQPERIAESIEALNAAGGPRVHRGCDFHLSFDNLSIALREPSRFSINAGRYLLVEFPDANISRATASIFQELLNVGLVPVITHPERNAMLRNRVADLRTWVEHGALIQITADSLTGDFGKNAHQFSLTLLRENLVHFVASDAHGIRHRRPDLRAALAFIESRFGADVAKRLFHSNPQAVIESRPLPKREAPHSTHSKGAFSWFGL
ncbi:MAG TPA: CpsB/CapC family capsule biosynthesis tyrosine phosphatase [Bryobacteraceae bacterium]|nr:CpsB/CapC family capsule biosynthesis tyrosine phosphatase [Bryobacteraceae bacterium]